MIVGFTIESVGDRKELADFIRKYCILESPEIADNIVKVWKGVNVFSKGLDESSFSGVSFGYKPIRTIDGKVIVASAVNFNLEVEHNGRIRRLSPTEYFYVDIGEANQFKEYVDRKLLAFVPEVDGVEYGMWILSDSFWNDEGMWIDFENWKDV